MTQTRFARVRREKKKTRREKRETRRGDGETGRARVYRERDAPRHQDRGNTCMETNDETRRQHPLQSRTGAYGYPIYLGVSDCIHTTARLWAGVGFFCEAPRERGLQPRAFLPCCRERLEEDGFVICISRGGVVRGNARDRVKQSSTHHKTKRRESTRFFGCEVERSRR